MEKCNHLPLKALCWGGTVPRLWATCAFCAFKAVGKTAEEVLNHFYPKEKTMSHYHAGYKKGVEDATSPLRFTGFCLDGKDKPVSDILFAIRKKLLTQKVTKYAVVCSRSRGEGKARAYFVYDDLFNGKNFADAKAEQIRETGTPTIHGVFPIEIEIPL